MNLTFTDDTAEASAKNRPLCFANTVASSVVTYTKTIPIWSPHAFKKNKFSGSNYNAPLRLSFHTKTPTNTNSVPYYFTNYHLSARTEKNVIRVITASTDNGRSSAALEVSNVPLLITCLVEESFSTRSILLPTNSMTISGSAFCRSSS